ncbi:MAG: UDP-N-acetylmuramoyl-tripeptide--D-alanyl-D-alanine ligase [Candidatus Pacebacteria bacterium]|nr:UDP-N-acetylmuramoyl-tripeptide--D-alanyl-D-alanine ligase [Candidatus Paceibacterota bacterium]
MRHFFKKLIVKILLLEARAVLKKYKPKIVAVTGSVGKTSAKDAIFSVLAGNAHVRKSQKSFNSEIGLPLTILGVPNAWSNPLKWLQNFLDGLFLLITPAKYPEWLVLEVGADRPGDIKSLAKWLPVDVAVITRLPEVPVHVEYFDSPEEVIEEKASLIKALKPGGTLVLYAGDIEAETLKPRAGNHPVITYGLVPHANVRIDESKLVYTKGDESWPIGMGAEMFVDGISVHVQVVGAIGAHALLPALAGAAVGKALNLPIEQIVKGLEGYEPPLGRMHLIRGIKNTLIIDDTYNSSPAAVVAALDALTMVGTHALGRKVAVLSDMLELGKHSATEHKKVGAHAAKTCSLLLTVGLRARDMAQGALDAGMPDSAILQFESAESAGKELQAMMLEHDVVLVKGSQSMRMEKVVEEVMAEPEKAGDVLVRQDAEWKKR